MSLASVFAFCRLPVVGQVKTRLASGLGRVPATYLYQICAEETFRQASNLQNAELVVACSKLEELPAVRDWLLSVGTAARCVSQVNKKDLGERMSQAIRTGLAHGASKVVVIGTDTPDLSQAVLKQALLLLDRNQVVLGPAYDGGYYLVGMNNHHPALFQRVSWSTATTRHETVQNAWRLGLSVSHQDLPVLRDIDTLQDLRDWHADAMKHGMVHSRFFKEAGAALDSLQSST